RKLPVETPGRRGVPHGARLRRLRIGRDVERVLLRLDDRFDPVVVGLEVVTIDRPVLALLLGEPLPVLPDEDVRVDDRATAEAARDERLDAVEGPDVEHPELAFARVPEVRSDAARAARELARPVGL